MIDLRVRKPILRVRRQQARAYRPGACGALHSPASLTNLASYHAWVCVAGVRFSAMLWSSHSSGSEGRPGAHMYPSRITWNKGKFGQTRRGRSADTRQCAREGARARFRPNLNPTSPSEVGSSSETPYMPRTARCQTDGRTNAEVSLRVIKRSREHQQSQTRGCWIARSVMARWSQWLGGRSILGVGVVAAG